MHICLSIQRPFMVQSKTKFKVSEKNVINNEMGNEKIMLLVPESNFKMAEAIKNFY